jgi:hypothetical protein
LYSQLLLSREPQVLPFVLDLWCVKVLEWEIFRCLHHDSALLSRSQWEHSSWTSSVVASWAVFRLKPRWAPMLGGPKTGWSPRTWESWNRITSKSTRAAKGEETKNLWKPVHASKVMNPFTRALAPPFIGCKDYSTKTLHPRNVGFAEFVNKFMSHFQSGKLCFTRMRHSLRNPGESHTSRWPSNNTRKR